MQQYFSNFFLVKYQNRSNFSKIFLTWISADPDLDVALTDLVPFTSYNVWVRQRAADGGGGGGGGGGLHRVDSFDGERDEGGGKWSESLHFRIATGAAGAYSIEY